MALSQRCPSTPSPEAGQHDGPGPAQPGNPLLALPVPSAERFGQGVRLLPSGEPRAARGTFLPCLSGRAEGTCLSSASAFSSPSARLSVLPAVNIG